MYLVLPCRKIAWLSWGTLGAGAVLPKAETYTQHHRSLTRIAFHNISPKRWPRWPEKAIEKSLDTGSYVMMWFLRHLLKGLAPEDSEKEDIFGFVGAEMSKAGIWCVDWIGYEGCFLHVGGSDGIIVSIPWFEGFNRF